MATAVGYVDCHGAGIGTLLGEELKSILRPRLEHPHWYCRLEALRIWHDQCDGYADALSRLDDKPSAEIRAIAWLGRGLLSPREEIDWLHVFPAPPQLARAAPVEIVALAFAIDSLVRFIRPSLRGPTRLGRVPPDLLAAVQQTGQAAAQMLSQCRDALDGHGYPDAIAWARVQLAIACLHFPQARLSIPIIEAVAANPYSAAELEFALSWQRLLRELCRLRAMSDPETPAETDLLEVMNQIRDEPAQFAAAIQHVIDGA